MSTKNERILAARLKKLRGAAGLPACRRACGSASQEPLRTVTSVLVTARGKPCIDVSPIPAETNEMGHFKAAFDGLIEAYPWVEFVSYDAGASSDSNGEYVVRSGRHDLFRLNNERHHQQ